MEIWMQNHDPVTDDPVGNPTHLMGEENEERVRKYIENVSHDVLDFSIGICMMFICHGAQRLTVRGKDGLLTTFWKVE